MRRTHRSHFVGWVEEAGQASVGVDEETAGPVGRGVSRDAEFSGSPYDTPASSGLRFLSELICWVAGPWAIGVVSKWLILPAVLVLVGLPSVFSTVNDKRSVVIPTPGPIRVTLEFGLYLVAMVAPWFAWSDVAAAISTAIVVPTIILGLPRARWLLDGAPSQGSAVGKLSD